MALSLLTQTYAYSYLAHKMSYFLQHKDHSDLFVILLNESLECTLTFLVSL